jgi:carbon starvation protein
MAICAKKGLFKFLWIPALPLAFASVVTITASFQKIFSDTPAIGYWAQHAAFKNALAAGEESFGTARTVAAMEAVVRNTFIQGTLSIFFVVLAIIVILTAILATIRAYRHGGGRENEDLAVPSRIFAPAGLIASPAEKELEAQWAALEPGKRPARTGH